MDIAPFRHTDHIRIRHITRIPTAERIPEHLTENMAPYHLVLIGACALFGLSHGLSCYWCASSFAVADSGGYPVTSNCHVTNNKTATVYCTGQCVSVFNQFGVIRGCVDQCEVSTSADEDVTCCQTDLCNNAGPQGDGWLRCYFCAACANDEYLRTDYTYCQGQCAKVNSEATILGVKTKTTIRMCIQNCESGELRASALGIVSGKATTYCCSSQECNGSRAEKTFAGVLFVLIALTFVF